MKSLLRPGIAACVFGIILAGGLWPAAGHTEPVASRFSVVLEGAGVKDNVTGLVWEREPDRIHDVWGASLSRCLTKDVGGQTGWRAPSIDELKTLIDRSERDPALPTGHPFLNIKSEIYWTATPHPTDDIVAWQVSFFSGEPVTDQKSGTRRLWCVLQEPLP